MSRKKRNIYHKIIIDGAVALNSQYSLPVELENCFSLLKLFLMYCLA